MSSSSDSEDEKIAFSMLIQNTEASSDSEDERIASSMLIQNTRCLLLKNSKVNASKFTETYLFELTP